MSPPTKPSTPTKPPGGAPSKDRPSERTRKKSLDEQIERAESEGMVTEQAKVSKVDPHQESPPARSKPGQPARPKPGQARPKPGQPAR